MKYNELLGTLQNLTGNKYTQEEVASVLVIKQPSLAGKIARESEIKAEDIKLLENFYNIDLSTKRNVTIDYYVDVFGSCGGGCFVLSENKEKIDVPTSIISNYSKVKQYSMINAVGDSMMPTIQNKDRLIVEHTENEQIKDNHVYVFCYNDEIYIKRLAKNLDEIIVKSDNPDPVYRPRIIEKQDINNIYVVGEIVGLMRNFK